MSMISTGALGRRAGDALVFTRAFQAPLDDVWAACTEPARMERWIGTWTGDPASGRIVFRMTAEGDDVPDEVYLVEACEPPRRFVLRSRDAGPFSEDGSGPRVHWQHTLELSETAGVTTLRFTQVVPDGPVGAAMVASVGPGWDYYLDRLVASYAGADLATVVFEPYLERAGHYRNLFS
jgi:uncharacterized protein YndB with AHSA1/START domain